MAAAVAVLITPGPLVDEHDARPARDAGVAVGRVGAARLVARRDVADAVRAEVAVQLERVGARDAEDHLDAVLGERVDDGLPERHAVTRGARPLAVAHARARSETLIKHDQARDQAPYDRRFEYSPRVKSSTTTIDRRDRHRRHCRPRGSRGPQEPEHDRHEQRAGQQVVGDGQRADHVVDAPATTPTTVTLTRASDRVAVSASRLWREQVVGDDRRGRQQRRAAPST